MDFGLALGGGLLILPAFAIIAALVKSSSRGPGFYWQLRIGEGGRTFRAWKFRTMVENAEETLEQCLLKHPERQAEWSASHKMRNDPRVTKIGRFLRQTSLDELPQIWNVIRGEMSLVGPRPLLPQYLDRYSQVQRRRHERKPGITGWAQIKGRNSLSWERKFELDVWYVDHQDFWLDLRILLATAATVFRARHTSQAGHATASEFMGSKPESPE